MKNKDQKLDQLLHQFMDEPQAHEVKDDLSFANRLFSESPVPVVEPKILVSIRLRVRRKLKHQKYLVFGKQLTIIAAIVTAALLAGLHILYSESPETYPRLSSAQTENTTSLWNDALYAVNLDADPIGRELTDLTESIHSISDETYEPTDTFSADLLEFEEIEFLTENTDFWKG